MVATTPKNSIPYPQQGDSPNEATAMANMVGQIDRRLVPRFTNAANRTSRVPSPSEGMIGYMLDTHMYVTYRSGAWTPSHFTRTVFKTANTARNTTTTATADPELTINNIYSGHTYFIEGMFSISSDSGVDAKFTLSVPTGTTGSYWYLLPTVAETNANNSQMAMGSTTTLTTTLGVGCFGTTQASASPCRFSAVLTTTNNGSISLDWAQNVSSSLSTTMWAGSWLSASIIA